MTFKHIMMFTLLGSMAGAEHAAAGGDVLPAKVQRYQKGLFSDVADLQIGDWGSKDLDEAKAQPLRLEIRYDYLRMYWWYGLSSPFTKAEFATCAARLERHAQHQDVFQLGFMGSHWPVKGDSMKVRGFALLPSLGKSPDESECFVITNRI